MQGGPHDQSLPLFGKTKTLYHYLVKQKHW